MFYLIVIILIALFYLYRAPATIKSTMKAIIMVSLLVLLLGLLVIALIKIIGLPAELFVTLAMLAVAYLTLRDISLLEKK